MGDWDHYPILGGGGTIEPSVWRATVRREVREDLSADWTCIVKRICQPALGAGQDACPRPWDNERSAFFDGSIELPSGLSLPGLFEVESDSDSAYLFMEDLDRTCSAIGAGDLPELATLLGLWHSRSWRADDTPQDWIQWYVNQASPVVDSFPYLATRTPLLQPLAAMYEVSPMKEFWNRRAEALDVLQKLGNVRAHQDLVNRNVFTRCSGPEREYILIDWSLTAIAPVGTDLASLLFGSSLLFAWSLEELSGMVPLALDAYMLGMDAESRGLTREALTLSVYLSAALRYIAWGGNRMQFALDSSKRCWTENTVGRQLPEAIQRFVEVGNMVGRLGLEALQGAK